MCARENTPEEVEAYLSRMVRRLKETQSADAIGIIEKIKAKAKHHEPFAERLAWWSADPTTSETRALCASFGDYWSDLAHQNAVDAIDAATLKGGDEDTEGDH